MRLGQGSHQRSPKWVWIFMAVAAACILPGAAMVVAQDSGLQSTPAPLSNSQTPTRNTNEPASAGDEYSVRNYDVSDQLQTIMQEGMDEQQASKELLQLLPSTAVQPTVDAKENEPEIHAAPLLKANSLPAKPPGQDKTTRALKNGRLIVNTNGRTHDKIVTALEHYRKYGFHQVMIKMTVMELHHVQSLPVHSITGASMIGTSVNSDTGIEGVLTLDDAATRTKVVLASTKLQEPGGLALPSDPAKIDAWTRSLQEKGIATILSRPQILTTNGREAAIHVGTRVPVSMTEEGQVVETFDVGFKSHVVPTLLDNGKVDLDIRIEMVESRKSSGIKTRTTSADGKPTWFDVPSFEKRHVETRIQPKLDTPISILGPAQQPSATTETGEVKPAGKRLMVLMTCHAVSPFNQQPKPQPAVPKPTAEQGETQEQKPSNKPLARETVIRNERCAIHINGDIVVQRQGSESFVKGTDIIVRIKRDGATDSDHWSSIGGQQGELLFDDNGLDSFESVQAKIQGNAIIDLNGKGTISAEVLHLRSGNVTATDGTFTMESSEVKADQIIFDPKTNKLFALGNVVVEGVEKSVVRADAVELNIETGQINRRNGLSDSQR